MAQAARERGQAAIVNTCSVAAIAGLPQRALYSATKGAVYSLTLAMAADHVAEGIRVNCVTPGTADTPWVGRLLDAAPDPAAERAALNARQPMGRLVSAPEVAFAIAYLASPLAGSTTGTLLASGTFSGESASGWQQVFFATPVTVAPGTASPVNSTRPESPAAAGWRARGRTVAFVDQLEELFTHAEADEGRRFDLLAGPPALSPDGTRAAAGCTERRRPHRSRCNARHAAGGGDGLRHLADEGQVGGAVGVGEGVGVGVGI